MGAAVPNYFRKPYGPGWALVGDAGYIKDPITAQGIGDAFQDAERCASAAARAAGSFEYSPGPTTGAQRIPLHSPGW